jgi:membrane-bound lytic murein transglycosylase A
MKLNSSYVALGAQETTKTEIVPRKRLYLNTGVLCLLLAACGSPPPLRQADMPTPSASTPSTGPRISRGISEWIPVAIESLPGWGLDDLQAIWNAWLRSCERANAPWVRLCPSIRQLLLADDAERRAWMQENLQAYRVQQPGGREIGLLTGYYEPQLQARRKPDATYRYPLHQTPSGVTPRKPWLSRQEMETSAEAQVALRGREIAYLADPVDVLILQIQGSGRVVIQESDGRMSSVRVAFAGSNEQPYQSVARWLLDRREIRDASWPSIKAWVKTNASINPERVNQMFWSNPRVVFFREESLGMDPQAGPRGAQGVPLTAGRSIAVDRQSIPYGTPVWLSSSGDTLQLNRLVMAQDTGSAIVGAVRADYFVGAGDEAGEIAGRLKQPLQLWALWPKGAQP